MLRGNWKRLIIGSILATLAGLGMVGCDAWINPENGGGLNPPPGEMVQSEKPRETSPDVPNEELAELVAGNNAFAFDLYRQLRAEAEGNLFYSPYSVSLALAMTYAGARNETEQQMADTLHFTLAQDRTHPAFNALDLTLADRGEGAEGADGEGFRLNIVNRIWGQVGYAFRAEFLDVLAVNYGAGLALLDFAGAAEESRVTINDWIAEQTEDRIKDLIPPGALGPFTTLVLTNAIYFNAAWSSPFDEAATHDGPFYLLDGSQITAELMRQVGHFGYAAGDGYQALELPYDGNELSMVIFLPDAGGFEEFDGALEAARVEATVEDLSYLLIDLTMPKFTFEWATSLTAALAELGMPIAFGGTADFSGMDDGVGGLFIGDVIHKAFVAVDEEGTEAAAATAVIMCGTSGPEVEEPLIVTLDRPFVFMIRDIETGIVLFVGRVLDPSA